MAPTASTGTNHILSPAATLVSDEIQITHRPMGTLNKQLSCALTFRMFQQSHLASMLGGSLWHHHLHCYHQPNSHYASTRALDPHYFTTQHCSTNPLIQLLKNSFAPHSTCTMHRSCVQSHSTHTHDILHMTSRRPNSSAHQL